MRRGCRAASTFWDEAAREELLLLRTRASALLSRLHAPVGIRLLFAATLACRGGPGSGAVVSRISARVHALARPRRRHFLPALPGGGPVLPALRPLLPRCRLIPVHVPNAATLPGIFLPLRLLSHPVAAAALTDR
jgi:hypothetical protein